MEYCRAGDRVVVPSIDRLGRSIVDLNNILQRITKKGADVYFVKENMKFSASHGDPMTTLMFNMLSMLSAFARYEREIIKDRQSEGITITKKLGKYKGRKPGTEKHEKIVELFRKGSSCRKISTLSRP